VGRRMADLNLHGGPARRSQDQGDPRVQGRDSCRVFRIASQTPCGIMRSDASLPVWGGTDDGEWTTEEAAWKMASI
jgi:hypothetical protein